MSVRHANSAGFFWHPNLSKHCTQLQRCAGFYRGNIIQTQSQSVLSSAMSMTFASRVSFEQIAALCAALHDLGEASPEQVARSFLRARTTSVQPLLESLTLLGQARILEGGRFAA